MGARFLAAAILAAMLCALGAQASRVAATLVTRQIACVRVALAGPQPDTGYGVAASGCLSPAMLRLAADTGW